MKFERKEIETDYQCGATAVEMSILTAVTWVILAAIFDFARYLVALTCLTFGAHEALSIAKSSYDLDRCRFNQGSNSVVCDSEVNAAITAIIERARGIATSTILSETAGAAQELREIQLIVPGVTNTLHPDPGCGELSSPGFTMGNVFKRCPIIMRLEADVAFMVPGLGRKTFQVQMSTYREPALNFEKAFPEAKFFPL